jgi:hypothetical protein
MEDKKDIEKENIKSIQKIEIPDEVRIEMKSITYNRDSIKPNENIKLGNIVRNSISDREEKQNLKQIDDEFQNMHLDVGNEFLVDESSYSGNIDISNKLMTDKVIIIIN